MLLAKCVAQCKTLKVFKLNRSKVDDDKVRVLISHLLDHPSITKLDLSHNVIGDRGARAIGKFLNNHSQLTEVSAWTIVPSPVRFGAVQLQYNTL